MQKIIVTAFLLMVCACTERDSNYDSLIKLNGNSRLSQFEKHSLSERFRLYNKIYDKSGHPRDAELSIGFRDRPAESLNFIMNDLRSSDFTDFLRYLPIIYDIGKRTPVDICKPEYIDRLKEIISGYGLSSAQTEALRGLKFDRCELP